MSKNDSKRMTEAAVVEECEKWITAPENFYNFPLVKSKNCTIDTDVPYTEIIAGFLLENNRIDYLKNIEQITREKTYIRDNHKGIFINPDSEDEEIIAMKLFKQTNEENGGNPLKNIGKIMDYQTPLKNKNDEKNRGIGKIDILSVNEDISTIYILELKGPYSDETMLRCVLEGYTYYQRADKEKLLEDLIKNNKVAHNKASEYKICVAPLVFQKTQPYYEECERLEGERKQLNNLITILNKDTKIVPFYLEEKEGIYICHSFN